MRIITSFLFFVLLFTALPLQAQFRSAMRQANKEYDLHAYNSAVESYTRALNRRPDDLEALSRIANSYRLLNQMDKAHEYYVKAVKDKKVSNETLLEHAHVLRAQGKYDQAKQWYLFYAQKGDPVIGNHYAKACDFAISQVSQEHLYTATLSPVNSAMSDFGPAFAGRGQVVFSSFRTDKGGDFSGQSINTPLVASFGASGVLQEPFMLQNGYEGGNVGPVSYSADGSMVLFTRNNFADGTRQVADAGVELTLWYAEVNRNGQWVNPRPLPFNGAYSSGYGVFSPDGQEIYFASDREGGYGGFDIYRATRNGNDWSVIPENLGTIINSVGNEITPSYDGLNLYFSSDWHYGLGCYDVFRTEIRNGRPTSLFHMGNGINSSGDDYGFIYDATRKLGYVVSNRAGGRGNEDIYRINQAGDNLVLSIRSASNGNAISGAVVDLRSCGDQTYLSDINGRYAFRSLNGVNCDITISKDGYQPYTVNLGSLNSNGGEIPVLLSKINEAYSGRIIDAQTRTAISGALIQLSNRGTGSVSEVRTDAQGAYTVAMQPYNTYDFVISAAGYESLNFPLALTDGSDRNVLSVLSLLPRQQTNTANTATTYTPATSTTVSQGYAVQLAALSKAPNTSAYNGVSDLGNVYTVTENGTYKVRLGLFATKAEAEAAKAALARRGYSSAFIVSDRRSSTTTSKSVPVTTTTSHSYTTNRTTSTSVGPYYVQLGAFSKPRNFNLSKAQQLGLLIERPRGELTLMLLSASSLEEAKQLQRTASSNGFSGAFIVVDERGKLRKL